MSSFARLRLIAEKYGIAEAAEKWNRTMKHTDGDAVSFASCVCAAAFDANRRNTAKAEAICDEVWADDSLMRERFFRDRRDTALEIFDDFKVGPFVAVGVANRYAANQYDVEVELRCCRCGVPKTAKAGRIANIFKMKCPVCGSND